MTATHQPPMDTAKAYSRLADRCALSEMCTGEALEKLRLWGIGRHEASKIVQRLVNERFIDDERFARVWVRDRLHNARWGAVKIRQSLRLKRLDYEVIEAAMESEMNQEVYFSNLAAALRSKGRSLPSPLTYTDRMKLMRFAVGRGYEPGLVSEMIDDEEYWRNEETD